MVPSPLNMWRKQRGLSQRQLGRAAGVTRGFVQHVASGQNPLTGDLRTYMERVAPDVVATHDKWYSGHEIGVSAPQPN
ncbi:MAG TPA: hypothetical protein DG761_07130 [Gammaproteobacteria bacterium]|nr:hypothetical protein [Gammaproteobacteria bacterium]